ncbi:uncharacterized protein TrAtP1_002218 [Trichoderma atroviride]|uniref:uncharacterized protein n=1 Tax=Hypocrea atroviridis TaxID=63577 RepID=UPI00331C5621|nr:hypothetical protein TrAtP1_002218 [Trichoderma atroviride]
MAPSPSSWAPLLLRLPTAWLKGFSVISSYKIHVLHRPVWNPRNRRSAAALFGRKVSPTRQTLTLFCLTLGQKGFWQGFEEGRRRSDKNHIDRTGGQMLLTRADVAQTFEDSPGENPGEGPGEGPEETGPQTFLRLIVNIHAKRGSTLASKGIACTV